MKVVKVLLLLTLGVSLFFISCPAEPYPPAAVVAAFEAVRDSAFWPVNKELFDETPGALGETVGIDMPDSGNGLSYSGDLTNSDAGGGNSLLEYDITIDAANVFYFGYTIFGTVDMTMSYIVDGFGEFIISSLTLTLDGIIDLTGGEINTITVNSVTIAGGEELGTITFDGDTYPANEFSFLPGT